MSTLQQRVSDILRNTPPEFLVDESAESAIETIFDMLQKAEADLQEAQERVETLKWQLAKAREEQS